MTAYSSLLDIYHQLDGIYLVMIALTVWAACFGHFLDWATPHRGKILVSFYWGAIVILYIAGIIFIGLNFSN